MDEHQDQSLAKKSRESCLLSAGFFTCLLFVGYIAFSLQDANGDLLPAATWLKLVLVGGCVSIAAMLRGKMRFSIGSLRVLGLVVALTLLSLLSALWSDFPGLVSQRSLLIWGPILSVFALTSLDSHPRRTFLAFAWAMTLIGTALSTVGVVMFLFATPEVIDSIRVWALQIGPLTLAQQAYGSPSLLRTTGMLGNPNRLASLLMITLPLSVGLTAYTQTIRQSGNETGFLSMIPKRLFVALVVQLAALLATFSRTGFVATFAACSVLLVLLYYATRNSIPVKTMVGGVFIGVLGLLYAAQGVGSGRLSLSLSGRDEIWAGVISGALETPFLGVGFGVVGESVLYPLGIHQHPHNTYLTAFAELGVVGFLLFVVLWVVALREGFRAYLYQLPAEQILLGTGLAVQIGMVVHGLAETTVLRFTFRSLVWAYLLGFLCHPGMIRASRNPTRPDNAVDTMR